MQCEPNVVFPQCNQPPILGTAISADTNTDPSLYDVVGRRFFIGARVNF